MLFCSFCMVPKAWSGQWLLTCTEYNKATNSSLLSILCLSSSRICNRPRGRARRSRSTSRKSLWPGGHQRGFHELPQGDGLPAWLLCACELRALAPGAWFLLEGLALHGTARCRKCTGFRYAHARARNLSQHHRPDFRC